jgi:hypothetical protein
MRDWADILVIAATIVTFIVWGTLTIIWMWS